MQKVKNELDSIVLALREKGYEPLTYYVRGSEKFTTDDYLIKLDGGEIYSLHHSRFLKRSTDPRGYCVSITHNSHLLRKTIQRFMWEHMNGPTPKGHRVEHINGNIADNVFSNFVLRPIQKKEKRSRILHKKVKRLQVLLNSIEAA
jgi:hypothetical protein